MHSIQSILSINWAELSGKKIYNIILRPDKIHVQLRYEVLSYDLKGQPTNYSEVCLASGSVIYEANTFAEFIDETLIKKMRMIRY